MLLGSVRGTVEMHGGAFFFRPLRIYDGDATLSLEGTARYRIEPGRPRFDLAVSANAYPLSRILEYLDFHYPVEARVSGSFPVSGSPEALSGGGALRLTDATLWGQKVSQATARIVFTPGRVAVEDLRAAVGSGVVGGRAALSVREKTFEARLAGDAIPLEAVEALRQASKDVTGKLSFELSGGGSFERPDLKATASISDATPVRAPHPGRARAAPRGHDHARRRRRDRLRSGPLVDPRERRSLRASRPRGREARRRGPECLPSHDAALSDRGPGRRARRERHARPPGQGGRAPSGTFTVTSARLDLPNRPGVLATSGAVQWSSPAEG